LSSERVVEVKVRRVSGYARGEVVKVWRLSFLGDVDPETGRLRESGKSIDGKILVVHSFRGSTVGTYVIYALASRKRAPNAIVSVNPDPVVIAGCILGGIPFAYGLPEEIYELLEDCDVLELRPPNTVVVRKRCR